MIEFHGRNPYTDLSRSKRLQMVATEVPVAMLRLKQTIEQREIDNAAAQMWLDQASVIARDNHLDDVFPKNGKPAEIIKKLGAGFNIAAFSFSTEIGDWVMKIGAQQATVPGWLNPSSEAYAKWYARNLHILNKTLTPHLPHLIPSPQYVIHTSIGEKQTSLVIQPFVPDLIDLSNVASLPSTPRQQLLSETTAFYHLFEYLRKRYGLYPDLGRKGNLLIQLKDNDAHLVLVDNGLSDHHAPSPFIDSFNLLMYHTTVKSLIRNLST